MVATSKHAAQMQRVNAAQIVCSSHVLRRPLPGRSWELFGGDCASRSASAARTRAVMSIHTCSTPQSSTLDASEDAIGKVTDGAQEARAGSCRDAESLLDASVLRFCSSRVAGGVQWRMAGSGDEHCMADPRRTLRRHLLLVLPRPAAAACEVAQRQGLPDGDVQLAAYARQRRPPGLDDAHARVVERHHQRIPGDASDM
jgi:hypothetical protein